MPFSPDRRWAPVRVGWAEEAKETAGWGLGTLWMHPGRGKGGIRAEHPRSHAFGPIHSRHSFYPTLAARPCLQTYRQ